MKKTVHRLPRILVWMVSLSLAFGMMAPGQVAFAADDETKLTVIHTNDVHARVDVEAYVASLAKEKRAAGENVLVVSAGDVLHGQPIATLSRGDSIVQIMNAVGYDAMAPGNHDFNYGSDRLESLQKKMDFPILAANVKKKVGNVKPFKSYIIKEIGGLKVGIFGLATPETATKTNPKNVRTLEFTYPVQAAKNAVYDLRKENCDVVIALTHLGVDEETWSEERSTAIANLAGIDVIIDGHSHTTWEKGNVVGGTLMAQTGSYGENIGVVELTVAGGKVKSRTASLVAVPTEEKPNPNFLPDPEVAKLISDIKKQNESITSQVVATTTVNLQGEREFARTQETNLGDVITDAMLKESGADVALFNGGGIRASIPAGTVTKGDILTVLPFGNYIVVKEMTGANIVKALELGISEYPALAGGFPQVAGIRFDFDPSKPAGSRVTAIQFADGSEFHTDKTYRLATNDFMAGGGDGYTMIGESGGSMIYSALDEVVIAYLQTNPNIKAGPDGRINVPQANSATAKAAA